MDGVGDGGVPGAGAGVGVGVGANGGAGVHAGGQIPRDGAGVGSSSVSVGALDGPVPTAVCTEAVIEPPAKRAKADSAESQDASFTKTEGRT